MSLRHKLTLQPFPKVEQNQNSARKVGNFFNEHVQAFHVRSLSLLGKTAQQVQSCGGGGRKKFRLCACKHYFPSKPCYI